MRVAWVGNSYIYFNDLPAIVAAMLAAAGSTNTVHGQVTPGGQKFTGHAADPKVAALLSQAPWDVVVLQDNSGVPGGWDASILEQSQTALIGTLAPLVPPSARLLLYGTWGHLRGSVYQKQREAYTDYPTMQRRTTAGYEAYAALLERQRAIELVPVGDAFQIIYEEEVAAGCDPTAEPSLFARLFVPDAFHPSRLGSYLAACTFALVLLEGQPVAVVEASIAVLPSESCSHDESLRNQFGAEWKPASISDADAERLRSAARRAVVTRAAKRGAAGLT